MDSTGNFIVTWQSNNQNNDSNYGIIGNRFKNTGENQ